MNNLYWGVSCGHHDAALAVLKANACVYASHAERYSRIKNDKNLHERQINEALSFGVPQKIFFYENPYVKNLRHVISGQYSELFNGAISKLKKQLVLASKSLEHVPIQFVDHHLSHACAGFYTSSFTDSIVVVCDAIGELKTLSVYKAQDSLLCKKPLFVLNYPQSVGLFYSAATKAVGLKPNEEEYILMGMAAFGNEGRYLDYLQKLIQIEQKAGAFPYWKSKQNLHRGLSVEIGSEQERLDFAAGAQHLVEKYIVQLFSHLKGKAPYNKNWVFAGGVALNSKLNSVLKRALGSDHNLWIFPNPGDAGSSLGAILAHTQRQIFWSSNFLGTSIERNFRIGDLINCIYEKKFAGLATGKAEFGPRALGHRSLFADPRLGDIREIMNRVKKREQFRPFACSVLEDHLHQEFNCDSFSADNFSYMQYTIPVIHPQRYPGITHFDGTCRIHVVNETRDPELYEILQVWRKKSSCPMLLHTSLNIKGEPLLNDLADVKRLEEREKIDVF